MNGCNEVIKQGSTLRGVLESETPSLPPRTPRFCRLAVRQTPWIWRKKIQYKKVHAARGIVEKDRFSMRFTDKLNSVSHFCLQFEWTTRLAIFGVSWSNLCGVSRFSWFWVNSVLNHQLYLGESFLTLVLRDPYRSGLAMHVCVAGYGSIRDRPVSSFTL